MAEEGIVHKIRVLVVEDDPFWRERLVEDLARNSDMEVVGSASSREEAVAFALQLSPNVILMDINLSENLTDGLEATREIKLHSKVPMHVIMLTSLEDDEVIVEAFRKGAINYVCKSSYNDIVRAVREAYSGKVSIHADAAAVLRNEIRLMNLSPMEREVYELKEKGLSKSQISKALNKSINTIKTQLKSIRGKLTK